MPTEVLGLVKAIYAQTSAPTNTQVIWLDTSLGTPLHKAYNPTSGQWEPFIYLTLIDNNTIKRDLDGKLYVDQNALAAYVLQDGSVTLVKMANVASGTIFYRKSAGAGTPEVQSLATLKADLGLTGTNSGDQDLSGLVPKTLTINTKPLNANIVLTPADIGSPAGSGNSTGTNTGDETKTTILAKLEITQISGVNTGDETAATILSKLGITQANLDKIDGLSPVYTITLPAAGTVEQRILGAVEGVDYPTGWVLSPDEKNIDITHNLGRQIAHVSVFSFTNATDSQLRVGSAAYTGLYDYDGNSIKIQSLATVPTKIKIKLIFE